jgi:PleD family two-component response regulator
VCKNGGEYHSESYHFRKKDGNEIPVEITVAALADLKGDAMGAILAFRDITEKRDSQQRLISLLSTDHLTGLANWEEFSKRLDETLAETNGTDRSLSLLLIDIDDFRDINDSIGHDAGDLLLTLLAERFREAFS